MDPRDRLDLAVAHATAGHPFVVLTSSALAASAEVSEHQADRYFADAVRRGTADLVMTFDGVDHVGGFAIYPNTASIARSARLTISDG
jgi:hypothetical protein